MAIVGLVEIFYRMEADIVAAVRAEGGDRKGVAKVGQGLGQQRGGHALNGQDRGRTAFDKILGRFRDIKEHQHRQVAVAPLRGFVDPRRWRETRAPVDRRLDRGVEVEPITFGAGAQPSRTADPRGTNQILKPVQHVAIALHLAVEQSGIGRLRPEYSTTVAHSDRSRPSR